jgi:pseudoazurin
MQQLLLAAALAAAAVSTHAADHVVNMLNTGKHGPMVFEPAYVKVAIGDTVVFKPTQIGSHYAVSALVPSGSKPFKGTVDEQFTLKIDKEGLYLYVCEPHRALGMAGVIQAGKPVNLAEAKTVAAKEQAGFAMGKDRFDKALAQVK